MNLLITLILIGSPLQQWPRIAVTQPYAELTGWQSDTAWVIETIVHDLAGEVEETFLMITVNGAEPSNEYPPGSTAPGTVVSSMSSILAGTALYILETEASDEDIEYMSEACINFEEHLEGDPPVVPVRMALVRTSDGMEVWRGSRNLTWFGGECAPIFDLPVLDIAVLSPDSSHLFFSILYGPYMEYFVVPSGFE